MPSALTGAGEAVGASLRRGRPDGRYTKEDVLAGLPGAISSVPDGMASSVLAGVNPGVRAVRQRIRTGSRGAHVEQQVDGHHDDDRRRAGCRIGAVRGRCRRQVVVIVPAHGPRRRDDDRRRAAQARPLHTVRVRLGDDRLSQRRGHQHHRQSGPRPARPRRLGLVRHPEGARCAAQPRRRRPGHVSHRHARPGHRRRARPDARQADRCRHRAGGPDADRRDLRARQRGSRRGRRRHPGGAATARDPRVGIALLRPRLRRPGDRRHRPRAGRRRGTVGAESWRHDRRQPGFRRPGHRQRDLRAVQRHPRRRVDGPDGAQRRRRCTNPLGGDLQRTVDARHPAPPVPGRRCRRHADAGCRAGVCRVQLTALQPGEHGAEDQHDLAGGDDHDLCGDAAPAGGGSGGDGSGALAAAPAQS
jgi:hypothetical protein